jgi:thioredoxin-like negative regulator of GroEL
MPLIEPFIPGLSGTFDDRVLPLSDHDLALAQTTRAYHCLAHTLIHSAVTLMSGEREPTEAMHAMTLGPALSIFSTAWRARVDEGAINIGTADPMVWLDELIAACEFVDKVYTMLMCASAGDSQWYQRPPAAVTLLIRAADLPEVPLLASEILDMSDYAERLALDVQEVVAVCS